VLARSCVSCDIDQLPNLALPILYQPMCGISAGDYAHQLAIVEYRQVPDSATGDDAHGFFDGCRGVDAKRILRHHLGYFCADGIDTRHEYFGQCIPLGENSRKIVVFHHEQCADILVVH